MKSLFLFFVLLPATGFLYAQNTIPPQPKRHVRFKTFPNDSAVLHFNKTYELIEDSCADIIRTAKFDAQKRTFIGSFRDVNKNNSAQLISEGNYNANGLKNGIFTCYYMNGILQSKGKFADNEPAGHWEIFYETGKPRIIFDSLNGIIKITDEWDIDGYKTVNNGKGIHISNLGYFSWKGKIENGLPGGTWHSFKTDDVTQTEVSEEHFKKGEFQKGKALGIEYTDRSRFTLIPEKMFPYTEAEKLHVSPINCNGFGHRHIVGARYSGGSAAFSEFIKNAIHPITSKVRAEYNAVLIIYGKVSKEGMLINLNSDNASAAELTTRLSAALRTLPALNPATADGKPIEQGFEITLTFERGLTHYSYKFLPIKQADVIYN